MTETIEIVFPDDEQEGTSSILSSWLKQEGDSVSQHDPVCEISTDKAIVEVSAPHAGTISKLLKTENESVEPGEAVALLSVSGEQSAGSSSKETPVSAPDTQREVSAVEQSEQTHRSLARYAASEGTEIGSATGSLGQHRSADAGAVKGVMSSGKTYPPSQAASHPVPHDAMRIQIAETMSDSLLHKAPHVTAVFECDMRAVISHRNAHKQYFAEQGAKLTFTSYFLKAMVKAAQEVPEVNSRWHDDHLQVFDTINVGLGTALEDKGLVLPVLRGVQNLDFETLVTSTHALVEKARAGKLTKADFQDATLSISNHGVMGSLFAAPIIIPQPQSAIVGIGKLEPRVKVSESGEFEAVPSCYITLSIDHRALDAFHTNRFLGAMKECLENWN